jgi:hypothetical protein
MDPQRLSSLDPKLRNAYERVMGTTIPQPQAKSDLTQAASAQTQAPSMAVPFAAPDSNSIPAPQFQPQPESQLNKSPAAEPQPTINPQPQTIPMPQTAMPTQQVSNSAQMNSQAVDTQAPAEGSNPNFVAPIQNQSITIKRKGGIMMPVLFGIIGLVFVVIYTLFWTKIFNLKLPFLP